MSHIYRTEAESGAAAAASGAVHEGHPAAWAVTVNPMVSVPILASRLPMASGLFHFRAAAPRNRRWSDMLPSE